MRLSWNTLHFPELVTAAISESKSRLKVDTDHMKEELYKEKTVFENVMKHSELSVQKAKEKSMYTQIYHNFEFVNSAKYDILEAKTQARNLNRRETLLDLPTTNYGVLEQLQVDIEPFFNLWSIAYEFSTSRKEWQYGPFLELDWTNMESDTSH